MKKNFGILNLLLIFITFIFLDYISKLWAIENLFIEYKSIQLTSFLSMTPVWNSGISFGFLQDLGEPGRYGLTIFAFSAKNWKCTQSEVSGLMCLFKGHIMYETQSLINNKV